MGGIFSPPLIEKNPSAFFGCWWCTRILWLVKFLWACFGGNFIFHIWCDRWRHCSKKIIHFSKNIYFWNFLKHSTMIYCWKKAFIYYIRSDSVHFFVFYFLFFCIFCIFAKNDWFQKIFWLKVKIKILVEKFLW